MRAAFAPIWHYFGQLPPTADAIKHFDARARAAARACGLRRRRGRRRAPAAFAFDLTVPGGQVKAAGVTIVGVLPTHRRRGYLRAMMRSLIDAARERGEAVAVLWATEDTIYGQFGYGMASMAAEIDLPREHAAPFARIDVPGQARLVTLDRGRAAGRADLRARGARDARHVRAHARLVAGPAADRSSVAAPGRRRAALRRLGDRRQGRRPMRSTASIQAFERGTSTGHIFVVEAMGDTPQATHAIWRFLFDIDWLARVKAVFLPLDHPLLLSLAAPRRLNFLVREGLWVRLIDVGAALSARGYATDDTVVIDVTDEFCPWNAGRWRVARGGVEKTDAEPDLACDVALARLRLSRRLHLRAACPLAARYRIARWRDRARRCNVPLRPRALVPGAVLSDSGP